MKIYRGIRTAAGLEVEVCDMDDIVTRREELDPRTDLRNHSPDGFECGYPGSGPSQLALALLADASGNDAFAVAKYQDFKLKVIVDLPQHEDWELSQEDVLEAVS